MNNEILRMVFVAHGVNQEQNNIQNYLDTIKWLRVNKIKLHRWGVRFDTAMAYLNLYAFNFDTIETDIEKHLGLDQIPF